MKTVFEDRRGYRVSVEWKTGLDATVIVDVESREIHEVRPLRMRGFFWRRWLSLIWPTRWVLAGVESPGAAVVRIADELINELEALEGAGEFAEITEAFLEDLVVDAQEAERSMG